MENKYYTPTIEEFHVGFEYEFRHPDYKDGGWKKYSTPEFNHEREDSIPFNGRLEDFRVKYLDREDIESLGFKLMITKSAYDLFFKGKVKLNFYEIGAFSNYSKVLIETKNKFGNIVLFSGEIKNKSELINQLKRCKIQ